ncbi:hypothetical protein L7F22_044509 [Adiantum nelumboides]|nr:hypothetical protein [Adiantum nelumboides]
MPDSSKPKEQAPEQEAPKQEEAPKPRPSNVKDKKPAHEPSRTLPKKPPTSNVLDIASSAATKKSASHKKKPSVEGKKAFSESSTTKEEKGDSPKTKQQIGQTSKRKPTHKRRATKPVQLKPLLTKRKFKQGVTCLREIRKIIKVLHLAVPRLPFQRQCRQVAEEYKIDMRWTITTLASIQEASEYFMIELFQDAYICAAQPIG